MIHRSIPLVLLFFGGFLFLYPQTMELLFSKEIRAFKNSDSSHFPSSNQILFVGSSSFTYWKDVQNDFPE
jgi:hypothetical protein